MAFERHDTCIKIMQLATSSLVSLTMVLMICFEANAHPCLESLTPLPLPSHLTPLPPLTLQSPDKKGYVLAGLVPDILREDRLAREKSDQTSQILRIHTSTASLYISPTQPADRYGRRQVFITLSSKSRSKPVTLLQERLLKAGLARLAPDGLSRHCANHLLAIEQTARKDKKGLWKLAQYQIREANALRLSATVSTYQIVHGIPKSINRNPNGTSYLNFGYNWQRDFTVTLSKKLLALWEKQNKSLDELTDAPIYVRGWVEDRGGPMIRISDPNQLWQE